MNDDDKTKRPPWEKLVIRRVTENAVVLARPCSLCFISITAGSGGPATAIVRNGSDGNAEAILDLGAPTSSMAHGEFQRPLYFSRGIFLEVGSNVTSVLVQVKQ